jgi:GNAT superfamily N-acetyltransferase
LGSALVDVKASPSSGKVEIVLATDEHTTLTRAFFREVWPGDGDTSAPDQPLSATAASVSAPARSPSSLAILDERVIGYLGTIPLRFWNGEVEQSGYWFKGFMVLPEFRNGPIGYALVKELSRHVPIGFVITVQPASWRLFKAIGLTHVGALENRLRLLRAARVFRKIDFERLGITGTSRGISTAVKLAQRIGVAGVGGMLVGGALGAWSILRGSQGRGIRTTVVELFDVTVVAESDGRERAGGQVQA